VQKDEPILPHILRVKQSSRRPAGKYLEQPRLIERTNQAPAGVAENTAAVNDRGETIPISSLPIPANNAAPDQRTIKRKDNHLFEAATTTYIKNISVHLL
jgi:hypothetical protein